MTRLGTDWVESAACLHSDPELFFPVDAKTKEAKVQTEQAKQVCAGCPVRSACLRWAVALGVEGGVFGGFSEGERRSVKRRARERTRATKQPG